MSLLLVYLRCLRVNSHESSILVALFKLKKGKFAAFSTVTPKGQGHSAGRSARGMRLLANSPAPRPGRAGSFAGDPRRASGAVPLLRR